MAIPLQCFHYTFPGNESSASIARRLTLHNWTLYCTVALIVFNVTPRHGQRRKHSIYCWRGVFTTLLHSNGKLLDCFLRIRCCGNVFTETLPRNERLFRLHYSDIRASCHSMYVFIMEGLTIAYVTLLLFEKLHNKNSDHSQLHEG
jgi:hypothetical protein